MPNVIEESQDAEVIHVRDLKAWGACCADLDTFRERFGNSVRLTRETIMENADLDLSWLARQIFEPGSDEDVKFWEGIIPLYNEARDAVNSKPYAAFLARLRHESSRGDAPPENGFTRLLGLHLPGNEAARKRFQGAVAELFIRVHFGEDRSG